MSRATELEPQSAAIDPTLAEQSVPKYQQIVSALRTSIRSGKYRNGDRLPSDAELVRRYDVSRMTVVKAMTQLQNEGLLTRRAGSGSYAAGVGDGKRDVFGLIIPDLGETEIFEPICKGIADSPNSTGHWLSWGNATAAQGSKEARTEALCQQYIEQRVSGIFFAPLEFGPNRDEVNHRVLEALAAAKIPVVLLDRCVLDYPERSHYDLVGLDNRRAGYVMTEHLISQGAQRVAFLALEGSAETVEDRIVGYREALYEHKLPLDQRLVLRIDPTNEKELAAAVAKLKIEALLCANDLTAAKAMRSLLTEGIQIPKDVRVAGIDDVRYAELLTVPLTTIHQPCRDLGAVALVTMLERIKFPDMPGRTILLNGTLVVRRSCGATESSSS